jgi:hypothetical protein
MPLRILTVLCVFCLFLAFGMTSCASRTTNAAPTAKTEALADAHSATSKPFLIIYEKSGDPLDETIIHEVYCPCYAMYTDEVI